MIRTYLVEVAMEIGDRPATIVSQLHYWHEKSKEKGYGKWIDGVHYIYNTYEQWHEQFPFWSVHTVRNILNKLVDTDVVFRRKYWKGWNQARGWALNYSHPICHFLTDGHVKNWQMDMSKSDRSYCYIPHQREHQTLTPVGETENLTSKEPCSKEKVTTSKNPICQKVTDGVTSKKNPKYREEYPDARDWLESQPKDFRKRASEYVDFHLNGPKVKSPQAFKMSIVVQIWRKYTDQEHHTDFKYIDKTNLVDRSQDKQIEYETMTREELADLSIDKEMQLIQEENYG
jgi:hypothetical protein